MMNVSLETVDDINKNSTRRKTDGGVQSYLIVH